METVGDFTTSAGTLNNMTLLIGGVGVCRNTTLTNIDASGGNGIDATGCTDGGGNSMNITF